MTHSPFFIVVAILSALFGLGFLFMPDSVLSWYDAATDDVGRLLARLFGAALICLAVIYFMARDVAAGTVLAGLLWAGLIISVLDLVLTVTATTSGLLNGLGWGQSLLSIVLGAGFAYFLFGKPART
ncbi:MAG: hypothetical protein WD036_01630 [Bauldia sp.]